MSFSGSFIFLLLFYGGFYPIRPPHNHTWVPMERVESFRNKSVIESQHMSMSTERREANVHVNYTIFTLHDGDGCNIDDNSYLATWIFEVPSPCTHKPFWDTVFYEYVEANQSIKYTRYDSGYNPVCDESKIIGVVWFPINECVKYFKFNRWWWLNFTISTTLPFDRSESGDFMAIENFQDHHCVDPYCHDKNLYDGWSTNVTIRTREEFKGVNFRYPHAFYCTQDWFAITYYFPYTDKIVGWKFMPFKAGECIVKYNNSLFEDVRSAKMHCWTTEEHESYDKSLPTKSVDEYIIQTFHFDHQCSQNHTFMQYALDQCNRINSWITCVEDKWIEHFYENWDCTGALLAIEVQYIYNIESCMVSDFWDPQDLTWYHTYEFINHPYFPNQAALVMTGSCKDQINIREIQRNQKDRYISYIADQFCFNRDRISFNNVRIKMKSSHAKCVRGRLLTFNFTQTQVCDGFYERIWDEFCVDTGYFAFHFVCIPYFCGIYTEFEENVCSGNGKCIGSDICICNLGWEGLFCETETEPPSFSKTTLTALWIGLGVSGGTVALLFDVVIILMSCLMCVCCVISCTSSFCCVIGCGVLCASYQQRRRLWKFLQLGDDFYMLVDEHQFEKSTSMNRFHIRKDMLVVDYEDIKLESVLGEGGSGATVYLTKFKGSRYAFKRFRARRVYSTEENFKEFEREVEIISSINHPNILRFFGIILRPPTVGILMEYCSKSDIVTFIKAKREESSVEDRINFEMMLRRNEGQSGIEMTTKIRWMHEISLGMDFLHSKGVIHRDLKNNNVLLDSFLICKIMDFGMSRIIEDLDDYSKTKGVGTSVYMAPEICRGSDYDEKVDVFSFGVMCYEILTENFRPYGELPYIEFKVANNPYFRPKLNEMNVDQWMKILCQRCWKHDSTRRPSFSEIHQYLEEKIKGYDVAMKKRSMDVSNENNERKYHHHQQQQEKKKHYDDDEEEEEEEEEEDSEIEKGVKDEVIVVYVRRKDQSNHESEDFLLMNKSMEFLVDIISKMEEIDFEKWDDIVESLRIWRITESDQESDIFQNDNDMIQEIRTDEDVKKFIQNDDIIAYEIARKIGFFDDDD